MSSGELLRDIYIYFRGDMKEIECNIFQVSGRFNKQLRAFISDDPSWEEIRSSAGQKLKRSDLVTKNDWKRVNFRTYQGLVKTVLFF